MKSNHDGPKHSNPLNRLVILLLGGCGLVLLLSFLTRTDRSAETSPSQTNAASRLDAVAREDRPAFVRRGARHAAETAEEQVAARLHAFGKNRRELARRYAEKLGIAVPTDLELFFDAADAGNWEEMDRLYKELQKRRNNHEDPEGGAIAKLLHTAQETWGAHECAREWPAQALLDYGRDVFGSLQPDMVYLGGTDPGRFIPTFLNDTSGGHHIVLTQNAFADATYLEYVNFLYGDRIKIIDGQDSQKAFNEYLKDAAKRYAHDQQFPDAPQQMREGENYKSEEGRVQVSGVVAVMSINELLVKMLQQKNPELSFAMEESFSLPSIYANAAPLGPLLQLGAENSTTKLTPAQAASSLDYWRDKINQLVAAPGFDPVKDTPRSYAHMIIAHGNLFSSQNLGVEAEQAYRLAHQLAPGDIEPAGKLYDLLRRTGREAEASGMLMQFQQAYPGQTDAIQKLIRRRR